MDRGSPEPVDILRGAAFETGRQTESFRLEDFHLVGPTAKAMVSFSSRRPLGAAEHCMSPGLTLAIASQVAIVQICAACGLEDKQAGVVISKLRHRVHQTIPSPGRIDVTLHVKDVRRGKQKTDHLVVDLEGQFRNQSATAALTYYFEPFACPPPALRRGE